MVGETIGHFRIVRKIGEGGMGHVYLAEDLRLDRQVALKVLAHSNPLPEQIERFEREAKAAAALNHPNILAIHDYGVHASRPYVVMELLDGRDLRQVLRGGPLNLQRALDYAGELVNGLCAAHDKGICHRDLKPENIFITHDGRVKILDFGLATNASAAHSLTSAADHMTRTMLTLPGVVLGTAGYIAPEQIRGERVDARADIFAFGAVLFEMLTGRRAFDEPTTIETLHGILKVEPPLDVLGHSAVPAAVVNVVRTCLQKERDDRFPSASALAAALKSARAANELTPASESRRPALATTPVSPPAPTPRAGGTETYAAPKVERVTNTSAVTLSPALSSDGRMVAYISDAGQDATAPQVWLQQVGGAAIRLTTGLRDCAEPAFSADDLHVLFTARGDASLNVYQVPAFGGEHRLLQRNARGARASPDGRWLSYLSLETPHGLRVAAADGEDDRLVAPELMHVSCAVWSPDSKHLLVRAHPDTSFVREYWIVPLDGRLPINTGMTQRFKAQLLDIPPAWVGASFIFAAGTADGVMLWRQRFAPESFEMADSLEPLTPATEWAAWPSAAANRIAFVNSHPDYNLWSIPLDRGGGTATGSPQRMTRGPGLMGQLSLTASGDRLAYFSTRNRKPDLVVRDLVSGTERVLTGEPANAVKTYPALSPSGAYLAYGTLVPGPRALRPIVVVDLANGTSRHLSDDSGGRPRQWIDERYLVIETFGSRLNTFGLVDTITGSQRELASSASRSLSNPRLSPDGARIAFDATPPGGSPAVVIAPIARERPIPESDWITIANDASHPFWSADGRLLYCLATMPNNDLRSTVIARRIDAATGQPEGDLFPAIALKETFVPTMVPGTAPHIASDRVLCVLADLRGDVWVMTL